MNTQNMLANVLKGAKIGEIRDLRITDATDGYDFVVTIKNGKEKHILDTLHNITDLCIIVEQLVPGLSGMVLYGTMVMGE